MDHGSWHWVIGRSDAREQLVLLYHDDRGVLRVFEMTFDDGQWTLVREDPDFHQRFIASVDRDRIAGRWEASEDAGSTWRKDFDLHLRAAGDLPDRTWSTAGGQPRARRRMPPCARSSISSVDRSSIRDATSQWCPNGSLSRASRSPQNWSAGSAVTVAPASTARRTAASTSSTNRKTSTVVPPRVVGAFASKIGRSSHSRTTVSPILTSAWARRPSGVSIRPSSVAPNARP